jgi:DNA-binding response OmpR family regulator
MPRSSLTLAAMSASVSVGDAGGAAAAPDATGAAAASLRIAILDRDSGFIQVLSKRLDRLAWEHRVLASPVPADAVVAMRLSALVVDLAVLGPQAWSWLERLCEALPELGIVVCTGPSTVAQRVRGLRLGADDWITKPCHPEEVIARVQSVVRRRRRSASRSETKPILAGEVEIRSDRFQAFVGADSIDLTRREFELIELLAAAEGRVLEREEIYSRLWGYTMVRGDRSVDVFVRKLRQKLEKASPSWRYIHTHFGIGYRFAAESVEIIDPSSVPSSLPAEWSTENLNRRVGDQAELAGPQEGDELTAGGVGGNPV